MNLSTRDKGSLLRCRREPTVSLQMKWEIDSVNLDLPLQIPNMSFKFGVHVLKNRKI